MTKVSVSDKRLRGIVKQFLPYGYMRRHIAGKYGVDMPAKGGSRIVRTLCDLMPFALFKDRELMRSIGGGQQEAERAIIEKFDEDRLRFERYAGAVAEGCETDDFARLANVADKMRRGELCGCANWFLERVVIHALAFPGEAVTLKLASLLRWMELPRWIEFAGAHDSYLYIRLGGLYNLGLREDFRPFDDRELSHSPILSFIVPVYNADRYLAICLDSLRGQSEKDIEIICIDDGSTDGSAAILDGYAALDKRIKVIHQENQGVSAARNRGLDFARGRYIAFVDGDDWVEADLARCAVDQCENKRLDIFFYDFRCFDTRTRKVQYAYWSVVNHKEDWILNRVFEPRELPKWRFSVSAGFAVFRRELIESAGLRFAPIKLGEDALFMYGLIPHVKRAWCTDRVKYHYRKGNPASAVARLSGASSTADAVESRLNYLKSEAELFKRCYLGKLPKACVEKCAERMAIDFKYHVLNSPEVAEWFYSSEASQWFKFEVPEKREKPPVKEVLQTIEERRKHSVHDLYVVAGQLKGKNLDPIDSWQFFCWLQDHGIPSRYLVWEESDFAHRLHAEKRVKDIIFTKTECRGDELLDYPEIFVRLRAFVVEWQLHTYMDKWLRDLPDCRYVFLQHGVIGTCLTEPVRAVFHGVYNDCNVSSERERALIDGPSVSPEKSRLFVGGLPRYDLLRNRPRRESKGMYTVLLMMTWRYGLNSGAVRLEDSAYYHGLMSLISERSRSRLQDCGVKLVLALHHSLADHVAMKDLPDGMEIAQQKDISKWIREADGMITDFSSAACDFMFQHKPTVFWIPDKDDLLLDRCNHQDGGKVDSALALQKNFYNICNSFGEVLDLVEHYSRTGFVLEPEKVAIADSYFDRNCESFSERIYTEIEKRL